jgi:preprotein translocase subunit SecF
MNVSAWSIRNPVPSLVLFVLLSLAGLLAFKSMKVQNFPDLDLPTIIVTAALPGAAPGQMETEVARKIENAVVSVQGLKNIYTKVQDGAVVITCEFRIEKPVQEALDEIRSAVNGVRGELPSDMLEPSIRKLDFAGTPVLAFTISSPNLDAEGLSWFVDQTVTRRLLSVKGVGAVSRVGGVQREVAISLDPVRMQALRISAADVSRQLKQVQSESAGGRTDLGGSEQPMRTLATVGSAAELADLELSVGQGGRIRLRDIAEVSDTIAERRSAAYLNGKPVVGFEISRSRGASEVEVGAAVQKALTELRANHPDVDIVNAFDFVTPVEEEYQASLVLLYEGAILAVLVVWLFLRDLRATFVSAVALPLSVIPAFIGMWYLGFSINVISLLALSLVVGILVDDAIVEVENIERHLHMGKTPFKAAMEAADEIGLAVIATTFTLVAVFLPTAFMSGVPGKFFKQFGWTAALAVFASLVVARMLTPMMAAYMLKATNKPAPEPFWMPRYLQTVRWCLNHRFWTALGAGAFFIGSLALIPLLPTGFIPPDDNSQTQVYLELPPGTSLAQTQQTAEDVRLRISKIAEIQTVYTTIGGGSAGSDPGMAPSTAETRMATLTIQLTKRGERPRKGVIENQLRELLTDIPGVRTRVGLGASGEKYLVMLTGDDPKALQETATGFERDLRTIPGLGSVTSSASLVRQEIAVRPDFARAADLGVTSAAIGDTLRIATVGDYDAALPKLNLAQRQVPIMVKLADSARQDLDLLGRLTVPGSKGPVLLAEVATLEPSGGPAVIDRYNRERNIQFQIELSGKGLGDVKQLVQQLPSVQQLPPGIKLVEVGDAEIMEELFASFALAMLTGILCIYLVLVLLFKSVLHPVTILAALPLSLGGAFVALLLAGKSFSMPSLIGLIMLMGVATKNSILLVEYAIVAQRDHGLNRFDALMDACHKRARPIVMTTIAMGAGMLPIAAGWGSSDGSFRSPMAVSVIGGLITSTFLSLLVIPAVYLYVDDFGLLVGRLWKKLSPSTP